MALQPFSKGDEMSSFKYDVSDAAAKRIAEKLVRDNAGSGSLPTVDDLYTALRAEHVASPMTSAYKWVRRFGDLGFSHLVLTLAESALSELGRQRVFRSELKGMIKDILDVNEEGNIG